MKKFTLYYNIRFFCAGIFFIASLCPFSSLTAQAFKTQSLELNTGVGRIIPHSMRFLPEITEHGSISEIRYHYRIVDKSAREHILNYPEFSFRLQYARFGNGDIFGSAWSFYPAVSFHLLRNKSMEWFATIGSGFSRFSAYYHPVNNPLNNVIGSSLNNITYIGSGIRFPLNKQLSLQAETAMVHMSNGSWQHPNLGINHWIAGIGLNYRMTSLMSESADGSYVSGEEKKWTKIARLGLGFQNNIIGGPSHFILNAKLLALRNTSEINKLGGGITVAYNEGEYRWLVLREPENRANARIRATDISLNIANEIRIRRIGLISMLGYYIYDPYFQISPVYFKLGFHHYSDLAGHRQLILFANIKTHFFIADYLEFGLAYAW